MSASAPTFPPFAYDRLRIPAAAFEVLFYLAIIAAASLAFVVGWLTVNGAVVLTVLLLISLIVLSWIHLGQGRHPVFLFLCTLTLFQGGRLLAYCLGGIAYPLQVQLMQDDPFSIGRMNEGIVLLCLALSAICLYAPCRWNYSPFPPPNTREVRQYLPYLYLLFLVSLPIQLYKNYMYYQWAQQHGGYASIYINHASLAASVPFFVRVIPIISFPVFVIIFVIEHRKWLAYTVAALYFGAASFVLLLGSRGAIFGLLVSLWYIARIKTTRRTRIVLTLLFAISLLLLADAIRRNREEITESESPLTVAELLNLQGISIDVLSAVVAYRPYFAPYAWNYPLSDLKVAFLAVDTAHYQRGVNLSFDVPVLLNTALFNLGSGTAGSYIAESYALGELTGVVIFSVLVGFGLHALRALSRSALGLAMVAMMLPDIVRMPRGGLLDWVSVLVRNGLSVLLIFVGWRCYTVLTGIRTQNVRQASSPGRLAT
ncbi:MAG: O-antigen polysaccharide polymerase Wzy [Candidatus Korobacteraceae bacterium]